MTNAGEGMNVRDIAGRKLPTVAIEVGLAYEFLMSLIVFNEKDYSDYELDSTWFDEARTKAGKELVQACSVFQTDCNHIWKHLLGIAYDSEPPRDVPTFLANVAATDAFDLRLHIIGYYRRGFRRSTPLDIILAAAEGDAHAQKQF